jgi:hypothetical protein
VSSSFPSPARPLLLERCRIVREPAPRGLPRPFSGDRDSGFPFFPAPSAIALPSVRLPRLGAAPAPHPGIHPCWTVAETSRCRSSSPATYQTSRSGPRDRLLRPDDTSHVKTQISTRRTERKARTHDFNVIAQSTRRADKDSSESRQPASRIMHPDLRNDGNKTAKLSQLTKEYKPIEVINTSQMHRGKE